MLCMWYGGKLVIEGHMTAGGLLAFIVYTIQIAAAIGVLSGLFTEMMKAVGASERIFEIMDSSPVCYSLSRCFCPSCLVFVELKECVSPPHLGWTGHRK